MVTSLTNAYRGRGIQATGWLIFAAIAGAVTITTWVASAVKPAANLKKTAVQAAVAADPLIKLSQQNPNEMATAVKPITFDAVVRDMRNYPPQFTDSRYLKANAVKWVIQIMNVAEHEVVTDYLKGREDKDNFKYFRIVDDNNQARYIVTYGAYNSKSEAEAAIPTVDFGLPSNVTPFTEEIRSYLAQVDEYEVNAPISNLGSKAPKEVKLHSTPKVIAAPKPKAKEDLDKSDATDEEVPTERRTPNTTPPKNEPDTAVTRPVQPQATVPSPPTQPRPVPAVPTRPVPRSETLVIQNKPAPAFVEKLDNKKAEAATKETKHTTTPEKSNKSDTGSQKSDRMNDLIKEKSQKN